MSEAPIGLAVIVEGHAETESVPLLVRRMAADLQYPVDIRATLRVPRSTVVRPSQLERHVELAARRAGPGGAVLVVIDADDDCPAELGPALLRRARTARGDTAIGIVLAHRELESLFLAGLASLRGVRGIPADAEPPEHPEVIRGAKERLQTLIGRPYSEVTDQPAFAAAIDLDEAARNAPWCARLRRVVATLLARANPPAAGGAGGAT